MGVLNSVLKSVGDVGQIWAGWQMTQNAEERKFERLMAMNDDKQAHDLAMFDREQGAAATQWAAEKRFAIDQQGQQNMWAERQATTGHGRSIEIAKMKPVQTHGEKMELARVKVYGDMYASVSDQLSETVDPGEQQALLEELSSIKAKMEGAPAPGAGAAGFAKPWHAKAEELMRDNPGNEAGVQAALLKAGVPQEEWKAWMTNQGKTVAPPAPTGVTGQVNTSRLESQAAKMQAAKKNATVSQPAINATDASKRSAAKKRQVTGLVYGSTPKDKVAKLVKSVHKTVTDDDVEQFKLYSKWIYKNASTMNVKEKKRLNAIIKVLKDRGEQYYAYLPGVK
jgi:hypothetical protein